MSEPLSRALADRMGDAVQDAYPGDVLIKWVAVVETLDSETGKRALITATSEGMPAWDSLGLLTYGVQLEQAAAVHDDDG